MCKSMMAIASSLEHRFSTGHAFRFLWQEIYARGRSAAPWMRVWRALIPVTLKPYVLVSDPKMQKLSTFCANDPFLIFNLEEFNAIFVSFLTNLQGYICFILAPQKVGDTRLLALPFKVFPLPLLFKAVTDWFINLLSHVKHTWYFCIREVVLLLWLCYIRAMYEQINQSKNLLLRGSWLTFPFDKKYKYHNTHQAKTS